MVVTNYYAILHLNNKIIVQEHESL